MPVNDFARLTPFKAALVWLLVLALTGLMPGLARSQSAPSSGSGVTTAICPDPGQCFANAAARQAWAKKNNCQFLEDICEKTPASEDNKGAKPEDQGFWSSLWGGVSGALKYGYEFGKGLFQGLKGQITDLIDLIANPAEVVKGLVELGKAFYKDPKGTLSVLGELLGQEAVDTIMRATQCGAYDLGKVIGSYVSPAVALKLAGRLGKYSASVGDAVKGLKKDLGCASFAGGTLVQLPTGTMAIEGLRQGEQVLSRHDRFWTDAPQAVERTFGRMAPRYRELKTEFETFRLTDEHPLWVQGKGWTPAEDVSDEDVLASLSGDVLVLSNKAVQAPLRVYNFSVAATPNYFVGQSGLWVHNAKCTLTRPADIKDEKYGLLDKHTKGFKGELVVREQLEAKGYTMVRGLDNKSDDALAKWKGQKGIDGIYKDKDGNYVIVESKATGGVNPSDPEGCVAGLCNTGDGRQMSKDWIAKRINGDDSLTAVQKLEIMTGLNSKPPKTKRIYAQSDDASGTKYFEIVDRNGSSDAEIGKPWNP